jgi:RNA polymerase sigma-70 factor (ECF subfamily)
MQTHTQVEKMMVFEKVKQALSNLKENYRMALTLFLIEEYDYKEISHCLNISYANSRTLISRAKGELRNELEKL